MSDFDDDLLLANDQNRSDGGGEPGADAPQTRFADVHAFVVDYLAHAWARCLRETDTAFRWCPHWHQHPAVLDRLDALWRAYEALHAEGGTGPARWWRDHADPSLAAITSPKGPFARCGPERHQLPPPLPTAPPPAGREDAA